jgi:hypothetical protein
MCVCVCVCVCLYHLEEADAALLLRAEFNEQVAVFFHHLHV